MRKQWRWGVLLAIVIGMGGCATVKETTNPKDYVEIENPFYDGSIGSSQTTWVPKRYVEGGVPRGGEVLRRGYRAATDGVADARDGVTAGKKLRNRIVVVDGGKGLGVRFRDLLGECGSVKLSWESGLQPPGESGVDARFLAEAAGKPGNGFLVYFSYPEEIVSGAILQASLYDLRGPTLLRSFRTQIQPVRSGGTFEDALSFALIELSDAVREVAVQLPWYGRVASVNGGRVFIDGGRESGLTAGRRIGIYRGGDSVTGIGFAPGARIVTVTIADLVGPDGAVLAGADVEKVQAGDLVVPE